MQRPIQEIRGMDTRELRGRLAELKKEQFDLRFHGAAEQVAKTSRHKDIRRTIARIMMVLGERDVTGQTTAAKTDANQTRAGAQQPGGKP